MCKKEQIQVLETIEQKKQTIPLYQEAFHDSESFLAYYYQEKCKDNWIIVKRKDRQIVAMLHLNPYTIVVDGKEYPTFYIVAVATKQEYRHQGHMRDLLSAASHWMEKREVPFCFLMPADRKIYEPFGFEEICKFDPNPNREEEEIKELFDIYCKRDEVYQYRFNLERKLAAVGGESGLPDHPIIMAAVVNKTVFRQMSGQNTKDESKMLDWLRKHRIYISEEV